MPKSKLLLHVCCIACGAYVCQKLKSDYEVILYFYNPNIWPEIEYRKRLKETERIAKKLKIKLEIGEYHHNLWLSKVRELKKEPEGGKRCLLCYKIRLEQAVYLAKKMSCRVFATTLTISPHKNAREINKIGQKLEKQYGLKYLESDWKKGGGFYKSSKLSRQLNLYRQNYCGCEFSRKTK